MRELFKQWLLKNEYTENTCANYLAALGAKHFGIDVFQCNDIAKLEELYADFGLQGVHADIGNRGNGSVRNALGRWLEFQRERQQSVTNSTEASTHKPSSEQATMTQLNQILYGPPGTGKTYHTINAALEILDPLLLQQHSQDRKMLKARFDELVNDGRVRFVTFHQSFSYEDFVEGLRAVRSDSGMPDYVVEPGVFVQICHDARKINVVTQSAITVNDEAPIWKISLGGAGDSPLKRHCLSHGEARIGWSELGDLGINPLPAADQAYLDGLGSNDRGTINYFSKEINTGEILVCINGQESFEAVGVVRGPYYYDDNASGAVAGYPHVLPVDWLYSGLNINSLPLNDNRIFALKTITPLPRFSWPSLLETLNSAGAQPANVMQVEQHAATQPYVLIIDEINRGNISRIFGELITLIEPSKRAGADEELKVTLPYSKKPFKVPDNLFLIGTMNTADRSLAGLDLALRRRFTFREMPPRPELLAGITIQGAEGFDLAKMLEVMNQRITVLLDRDHCLGHAYFLPLQAEPTLARLAAIFRQSILPLLQEYFFEDWERIRWVLNDQSKKPAEAFIVEDSALKLPGLFPKVYDKLRQSPQWTLNDAAFANPAAYLGIIASVSSGTPDEAPED